MKTFSRLALAWFSNERFNIARFVGGGQRTIAGKFKALGGSSQFCEPHPSNR